MQLTLTRTQWKVAVAVFSGVVAPLGVRLAETTFRGQTPPAPTTLPAFVASTTPQPTVIPSATQIVIQGTGPTADEAFHNAVDSAVRHAVAAQVDAATWQRYGPAFLASVRRDGTGIIRGWRELSNTAERRLTGKVYRSEVSVEVDASALRERLGTHAARPRGEPTPGR